MSNQTNKLSWFCNRLRSMGYREILWRIRNELLAVYEYLRFHNKKMVDEISYKNHGSKAFNIKKLGLRVNNQLLRADYTRESFAGFLLSDHNYKWSDGFNTENTWPLIFAYSLDYKGAENYGDARTNWQLNRNNEFVLIAKKYYLTKEKKYYDELFDLYNDWNDKNPFLFGISWTSPMEVAIRCSNWIYTYFFLHNSKSDQKFLDRLKTGIINMADYVSNHHSRYSSANNHLIVELYCSLLSAFLCGNDKLISSIYDELIKELRNQNFDDGVNKEQSLHYEAFSLEAFALSAYILKKAGKDIDAFKPMIGKMCAFVSDSLHENGEAIEFGDNDEGYILKLGDEENYYKYVLNLCSETFSIPYNCKYQSETLAVLFNKMDFENSYQPPEVSVYPDGGYAFVRDKKNDVFMGIDFGELGFGSIAAHGHADALSFQLMLKGKKMLIDPGTFIYHINREKRDYYRKTANHNTVCVDGKEQSEIKGSFLWGKRAHGRLIRYSDDNGFCIELSHDGYGFDTKRKYLYDWNNNITINDDIGEHRGTANFTFAKEWVISITENRFFASDGKSKCILEFNSGTLDINKTIKYQSVKYGLEEKTTAVCINFEKQLETKIRMDTE